MYAGGYVQDEWRPKANLTVTAGLRVDVPKFGNTAFDNPIADALTFRDQDGSPVKYNTGALPETTPYWSPRVGFNWDVNGDQTTQVRGGTGLFTGKPPYVWISNQIGNTGVLYGFIRHDEHDRVPVQPEPGQVQAGGDRRHGGQLRARRHRPGLPVPADLAHQRRRRPQAAVGPGRHRSTTSTTATSTRRSTSTPTCRRRQALTPASTTAALGGTAPALRCSRASPSHSGVRGDRPGRPVRHAHQQRAGQPGHRGLRDQEPEPEPVVEHLRRAHEEHDARLLVQGRLQLRRVEEPGRAVVHGRQLVGRHIQRSSSDPNNPALAYSTNSPGKRVFLAANYTKQYFGFGATTVSVFYDGHTNGNTSYIFAGDANGDGVSGNDLIYIPRDTSEMNFKPLTVTRAARLHRGGSGGGVRHAHQQRHLPELASRPVRRAQRGVPADGQPHRPEHHAGRLPQHRRAQALRPDPPRHHQLRQPAEPQLGRRPAAGQHSDPDQPDGRRRPAG